jgi:hypothetical protein
MTVPSSASISHAVAHISAFFVSSEAGIRSGLGCLEGSERIPTPFFALLQGFMSLLRLEIPEAMEEKSAVNLVIR